MENLLFRIKTHKNVQLNDDVFVEECMELLTNKYPQITGYTYERTGPDIIQLMIWGNLNLEG